MRRKLAGPSDAPPTPPDAEVEWNHVLTEGLVMASEQAQLLKQAAAGMEGPDRLDRPFLLVEHPFGRFEKWLSETVLVAYLAATTTSLPTNMRNLAEGIASELAALVGHRAYRRIWLRLPYSSLTSVGGAQAMLHELGEADPEATQDLQAAAAVGRNHWTERGARHALERSWLYARLHPDAKSDARPAWSRVLPHPIYLLRSDIYAITHEIWFGTDFGRQPLEDESNVAAVLGASSPWLTLIGDLDCLGEVIAAHFMLGLSLDEGLSHAYRKSLLQQIQAINSSRRGRLPKFSSVPVTPARPMRVVDYHSIYVGVISALARLRRGCGTQVSSCSPRRPAPRSELVRLAQRQLSGYFPTPELIPADFVASMSVDGTMDGLLISAARQFRLDWISDLLSLRSVRDVPTTWTSSEVELFASKHILLSPRQVRIK